MASEIKKDIIPAESDHSATLIFLHGLGDRGENWVPVFESIRIPHIKYIFPTAPTIPVTWQNGAEMPAWFDIGSISFHQYDASEGGIKKAVRSVHAMIEEEIQAGIPSERIILAGFSQGGGLALHSGLTFDKPLAALVALSCRLPLAKRIIAEKRINFNVPILHCYGDSDQIVPKDVFMDASNTIKNFDKNYTMNLYPKMAHTTCAQELNDVKAYIEKYLPPNPKS